MRPLDLLQQHLEKPVLVELKGGRSYRGTLKGFDQHLNVILAEAQELREGQSTVLPGLTLLRGDNVVYISP